MPLVRIDVEEGRSPEQLRRLADVVQEVMLEVFDAPDRDRYQIITVHPVGQIIAEDTNLGFERTNNLVILQIFQQGRTDEHKKNAYRRLAEAVTIPVVASGGAGSPEHLRAALADAGASAALAASIFHYKEHSIRETKDYLAAHGVPVRRPAAARTS